MNQDRENATPFAVHVAIQQADSTRPGSPIVERLVPAATGVEFWLEAAAELHRLDRHFDALDCWKMALQSDAEAVDRCDMADTLLAISSGNDLFAEEALKQYEMAESWQGVAFVRERLKFGASSVLAAIELALGKEAQLDWDDYWEFGFSKIEDWRSLGEHYLHAGDKPKAMECFGKALLKSPEDLVLAKLIAESILEHVRLDIYGREV